MNVLKTLIATSAATAALAAPALGQAIDPQRFGLYVLVDDMQRSSFFYGAIFERTPQVTTPTLIGFDVAGGLFGIVSRQTYAPDEPRAGSVRPYIRVADIDAAFRHVMRVAPGRIEDGRIVREGAFSFFRFTDPDGNVVELFAVEAAPAKEEP